MILNTAAEKLSLVLRIAYFFCSFIFAFLITIGLSVLYLGSLSNPALNRIDVGSFVVGVLLLSISFIAACWLAYLPLRRHPGILRAATAVFALVIFASVVSVALIDWG